MEERIKREAMKLVGRFLFLLFEKDFNCFWKEMDPPKKESQRKNETRMGRSVAGRYTVRSIQLYTNKEFFRFTE